MEMNAQILIDHYKNPRCRGVIENPDFQQEVINRKCGDRLLITARCREDQLEEIRFEGSGCFYCLASASVACTNLTGLRLPSACQLAESVRTWLDDKGEMADPEQPELRALGEIKQYPMRIVCVDLAWKGITEMLDRSAGKNRG